jgi:nicotinate-nucleotide--dimethylbenzimidazole phosphoribosyltransferase
MSVAGKGSYLSRFFVKLIELMAAAVATAVSGYLVAHLSGYLPPQLSGFLPSQMRGSAPAVVETVPNQSIAPKISPAQPTPAAADASEQRPAPQQDSGASAAKKSAKTVPAHKSAKSEASAVESKGTESKPREGADSRPHEADDKESVEARVRAALANVDANRPAPPRPADVPAPNPASAPAPRAVDLGSQPAPHPAPQASLQPPSSQTAPNPPAAVQAPIQANPVQPAPAQADPLTSVEIKSRPVATVDETAPAPEQPAPPPEQRGLLSAIKHIFPDLRRPTPTGEPPRPPAPVGDDSR